MPDLQVSSVAQSVLPAETVGLTAPQGQSELDQSPISSISLPDYIGNRWDNHTLETGTEACMHRRNI
jgi:hypothetical protein